MLAQEHARALGAEHVGSEHRLIGVCETAGPAAEVLAGHGVRSDDVRAAG